MASHHAPVSGPHKEHRWRPLHGGEWGLAMTEGWAMEGPRSPLPQEPCKQRPTWHSSWG